MKLRWLQLKTGLQDSLRKLQYLEQGIWYDVDIEEIYSYETFSETEHKEFN